MPSPFNPYPTLDETYNEADLFRFMILTNCDDALADKLRPEIDAWLETWDGAAELEAGDAARTVEMLTKLRQIAITRGLWYPVCQGGV